MIISRRFELNNPNWNDNGSVPVALAPGNSARSQQGLCKAGHGHSLCTG